MAQNNKIMNRKAQTEDLFILLIGMVVFCIWGLIKFTL